MATAYLTLTLRGGRAKLIGLADQLARTTGAAVHFSWDESPLTVVQFNPDGTGRTFLPEPERAKENRRPRTITDLIELRERSSFARRPHHKITGPPVRPHHRGMLDGLLD